MKLRKILASFLAGAIALTSIVVTTVTASAAEPVAIVTTSARYEAQNMFGTGADIAAATKFVLNVTFDDTEGANGKFYLNVGGGTNSEVTYATDGTGTLTITPGETYNVELPIVDTINQWWYIVSAEAYWGSFTLNSVKVYNGPELINVTPAPEAPYAGTLLTLASNPPYNWQGMEAFTVNGFSASTVQDVLDNVGGLIVSFNINGADASSFTDYANGNYTAFDYSQLTYQVRIGSSEWIVAGSSITSGNKVTITVTAEELAAALEGKTLTEAFTGFEIVACAATDASSNPIRIFHGDVTATVPAPTYAINVISTTNGAVTAKVNGTAATEAEENETVTLDITPDAGYEVDTISVSAGTAAVAVTDNSFTMPASDVEISVTFKAIEVERINITPSSVPGLLVGSSIQLEAEVIPEDALDTSLTWSSSNTAVATVDNTGKVTAIAEGTADITAVASNGAVTMVRVTVVTDEVHATAVELLTTELNTVVGDTNNIGSGLTIEPANCTDIPVWTTSDASVATVTANGVVTSVGAGTATITVTVGELVANCIVVVEEPVPDDSPYDKVLADFAEDTIVAQTAVTYDDAGVATYSNRFVMMVSESKIENKDTVKFTLTNGTATKVVESSYYYTALTASGQMVYAPKGYVFLVCTVTDIPDGVTVTCTDITLA